MTKPSFVPSDPRAASLRRLRQLSYLLDNAIPIPGTSYRIGIDPILGLLPGAGDLAGTAASAFIVVQAARWGLPRATLTRMALNILFETVVGSIPVLGDVVDAGWKANMKNMALLEAHLNHPQESRRVDWLFLSFLLAGLFLVVMTITIVSFIVLKFLVQAISG
ncbi:MAG: DUF4112 domain-containing protein [Kastovskya adunca ATA6-11-RM4]|jgi:hypothetical protein|nr:DUF4112 domain-containing protein [Kastovskya adunca ATA6-11-RM4]